MTFFSIVYRNEPDCLRRYQNPEPFNMFEYILKSDTKTTTLDDCCLLPLIKHAQKKNSNVNKCLLNFLK